MRKIIFVYLLMCLLVGTAFAQEEEGFFWDYVPDSESNIHNLNSGNVGIGTDRPDYKLDVDGTVNATGLKINGSTVTSSQWSTNGSKIYYNDGYVGIGTNNPSDVLHIKNSSSFQLQLENTSTNGAVYVRIVNPSQTYWMGMLGNKFFIRDVTGGKFPFTIEDGSGNVGIGTSSPTEKLEVAGNILLNGNILLSGTSREIKAASGQPLTITGSDAESAGFDVIIKGGSPNEVSGDGGDVFIYGGQKMSPGTNGNVILANSGSVDRGYVGIGTSNPTTLLTVDGIITAEEIIVEDVTGADFVFEDDYNLKSLNEVENFISTNKHLPDIPSAAEVEANGVSLGEMQSKLLQKVEELTLYMIELKKENNQLKERIAGLEKR